LSEEAGFLSAIRQTPADDIARLVYADWLDEQGGPANTAKAEFIRLELELAGQDPEPLRQLASFIDRDWLAVVSHPVLEACQFTPLAECPKQWAQLTPTANTRLRFCERCREHVRYCDSLDVARDLVLLRHAVAVSPALVREPGDLYSSPRPFPPVPIAVQLATEAIERTRAAGGRGRQYTRALLHRSPPAAEEPLAEDQSADPPPPARVTRRQGGRGRNRNIQRENWEDQE
jgi:uncharacterized protein (TIGR02996 family)